MVSRVLCVGDAVRHVSGGPVLTVERIDDDADGGIGKVAVIWFEKGANGQWGKFHHAEHDSDKLIPTGGAW